MAIDFKKQGKTNRKKGVRFEHKVRDILKDKYVVIKWDKNVEFPDENLMLPPEERIGKLIQAKKAFNPFTKRLGYGNGFPDFCFYAVNETELIKGFNGCEVKTAKYLKPIETDKCAWLLEQKIFRKIYIAYNTKNGIRFKNFATNEDEEIC